MWESFGKKDRDGDRVEREREEMNPMIPWSGVDNSV